MIAALMVPVMLTLTLERAVAQQPQPPQPPQPGPCSLGLDGELQMQCMQANGLDVNGTLFVLSGNRSGALPPGVTYDGFRKLMCQQDKQDLIVPCILQLMQKWNKTTCKDDDRYIMALRGSQIAGLVEAFCSDPCNTAAMQTMIQCFAAIKVNPLSILNENATILTDKFSFVGNDSDSATTFCSSRQRLFSCLGPLNTVCPPLIEKLYAMGIDLGGLERATEFLCKSVDSYLKGQSCVTSDKPALVKCSTDVDGTLLKIADDRFRTGLTKPSQYQDKLCEAKLKKVDCQLKNMASACGDATANLVTIFECTSIPSPCQKGATTKSAYDGLCQKVTTPAPTVTQRPTPPPKPLNPISIGVSNLPNTLSSTQSNGARKAACADRSVQRLVFISAALMAVSAMVM